MPKLKNPASVHDGSKPPAQVVPSAVDAALEKASAGGDRRRIIRDIIVAHYTSATTHKLKLVDVAKRAGISRQALDQYYADLKPYIAGKRNVTDLVDGTEAKARVETQVTINATDAKWKARLEKIQADRDDEIARAISNHITTLMNGDLAIFESNQLRKTLEKQTLYAAELKKEKSLLELRLATLLSGANQKAGVSTQGSKFIYDMDIEHLCIQYQRTKNLDDFDDGKDMELKSIREKFSRFMDTPKVHVILFADRYICKFRSFADSYPVLSDETALIVRLPLFTRGEISNFTKHIPTSFKISLFVPYMPLEAERKAQRVFIFQQTPLPQLEIAAADNADTPQIAWGLDQIVTFKVKQGD